MKFARSLIWIICIVLSSKIMAIDKEDFLYRVPIPLEHIDNREYATLVKYFFEDFAKDPLILKYFGNNSLIASFATREELSNGCLDVQISNIYAWEKGLLYELTCKCSKYSAAFLEGNVEYASPVILVYVGKNNKLQRINWCPFLNLNRNSHITYKDKALKEFIKFLKKYKVNGISWPREKVGSLFISLVCHCSPYLPEEIVLLKNYPGTETNQLMFVTNYGDYKCKYLFTFSRTNEIQEVTMWCD